jgi:hypothetical protein
VGSRIFYTTDGITSPIDTNNPAVKRYTSALSISTNTTVKTVAFSKGYVTLEDSVATAVYAIKIRKITLTAPAESQQFTGNSVNVGWTTENFIAGTDGKFKVSVTGRPDVVTIETSYMITNLVTGSYSVTVALTDMSGNLLSPNVSGTRNFTVDLPNVESPVISPAGGEYNDSAVVSISCETAGATIFVSLGGAYTEYSGQRVLRENTVVSAYAVKADMDTSAVVSETYTIIRLGVSDETLVGTGVAVDVYPNPTNGKFNVVVAVPALIEIFSQSGVCVEKKHVSEKAEFVLVSKGLYLLRATDAKGNVSTQKIIVK